MPISGTPAPPIPQDPAFDPRTFYLPQTRDAQQAVEKARQVQVAAVEAFAAYAVAKVGKDKTATLQEKQAAVIGYLVQFPTLLNAVRGLMGKSPVGAVRGLAGSCGQSSGGDCCVEAVALRLHD